MDYKRIFLFLLGILLLGFILYMVDFFEVMRLMLNFPLNYFLILLFIEFLIILFSALKWKVVLKRVRISLSSLIPISMIGYLVNNITPIGIAGGEPVRAYLLYKTKKVPIERSFASVIIDLFLEILPIFMLALISIIFILLQGMQIEIALILTALTLLLFSLFIISISLVINESFSRKLVNIFIKIISHIPLLNKKVENAKTKVEEARIKFTDAIRSNMTDLHTLFYGTIISLIKWFLVLTRVYLVFLGLRIKISFLQVLVAETAVLILSGIPLLPGALGIWEGASILLFSKIANIPSTEAAAATLIDRILFYLIPSLIGAIFAIIFGINILKSEEIEKEMKIKAEILRGSKEEE